MARQIDLAEQQILGFHHAKQGFSIRDLVSSMGLSKVEWATMKNEGMCEYLPDHLKSEIEEYLQE